MKEHCRKLFMTFIWVIMAQLASWTGVLDEGMAKKEAWSAREERMKRKQRKSVKEKEQ